MKYIDEALIYCDGDCKPNPGIMVGAFLITYAENILKGPVGNNFGDGTNIVAELKAIKYALDEAVSCTSRNFCPPVLGDGWVCGCRRQPHKSEFSVGILFKVGSNYVQKIPPVG
jgi:hypothetical protein